MTRQKKPTASIVRSSAAEYLTFVAASGTGGVEAVYADENVWLSQKMMAQLYDVEVPTINYHLKKVFEDSELEEGSVVRKFRITAADGKTYDTKHYNLSAIIAVGYKVNSERAVQFRKWATRVVEEFTIKGFAMDDERLKRGGSVLSDRYFDEQLQRVREIRLSERKFYQKIKRVTRQRGRPPWWRSSASRAGSAGRLACLRIGPKRGLDRLSGRVGGGGLSGSEGTPTCRRPGARLRPPHSRRVPRGPGPSKVRVRR